LGEDTTNTYSQPVRSDDRTDGMQTGSSVLADRGQKPQAHAKLVEKSLAFLG